MSFNLAHRIISSEIAMADKRIVVIGLLGTQLDVGTGDDRPRQWRPTVSVCQHDDFPVHRLELLYQAPFEELAHAVGREINNVSPKTKLNLTEVHFSDPRDLREVFTVLYDFAGGYEFDTDHEQYFVHITTGTHVAQICLFLLTESHQFPAKLLQTSPPKVRKEPPGLTIIDLDLARYEPIAARFRRRQLDALSFLKGGIPTRNDNFNRLIDRIEEVASASKDPILLMGPTGAGKSLLAKRIYELKKRRHGLKGDFIEINCATIRGDTAMSTLFGHVKGAFTGAVRERTGLLRAAHKGILFLDEIGELGSDEQTMMLRALEEKSFLPFGADNEVRSDFQLIAGTNQDLPARVRSGHFRADLLARIKVWTFRLPALRDRLEDIEPNLKYELAQYSKETGARVSFNKDAYNRFLTFSTSSEASWVGNFRDLNGALRRMATLTKSGRISIDIVEEEIARLEEDWHGQETTDPSETDSALGTFLSREVLDKLDPFDRVQLEWVIKVCRKSRNISDAGRKVFSTSRKRRKTVNDADRLRKYLKRFDLEWEVLRDRF